MKIDRKKAAVLSDPVPLPDLPAQPWVERTPDGAAVITANGLQAITMLAERGRTQDAIASSLGLSKKHFESQLGKADVNHPTPARLAWESGFARHKSSLIEKLTERALRGDSICGFFVLKVIHNCRDAGAAVEINNTPRIEFVLPAPMSEEAYLASLGLTEAVDTRDPKLRKETEELMRTPQLQIEHKQGETQ